MVGSDWTIETKHKQRKVGVRKQFRCRHCSISFSSQQEHKAHNATVHPPNEEKLHACNECQYRAISSMLLEKHVKTMHSEEVAPKPRIICAICAQSVASRAYNNHFRGHPNGTNSIGVMFDQAKGYFICPICKKRYNVFSSIETHMLTTHTVNFPKSV